MTTDEEIAAQNARRRKQGLPPLIPEIAKAFQNDPRTQMAQSMMQAGGSTAPVAQGGYGVPDGIARMLQGVAGGYITKKQREKYRPEDEELSALRRKRGVDALTGLAAQQAPVGASTPGVPPPQGAPQAPQPPQVPQMPPQPPMASAPPPSQPQGPMPGQPPMQPPPPQAQPPQMPPPQQQGQVPLDQLPIPGPNTTSEKAADILLQQRRGGQGTGGALPFSERNSASGSEGYSDVPNMPDELPRPDPMVAPPTTQSKLLRSAYEMMADANPFESTQSQDMLKAGLAEQGGFDAASTDRAQRIAEMMYRDKADAYNQDVTARRGVTYADITGAKASNRELARAKQDQGFRKGESALDRAAQISIENKRIQAQIAADTTQYKRQLERDAIERTENDKIRDADRQEKHQLRIQEAFLTPTGMKINEGLQKELESNIGNIRVLDDFENRLNKGAKTGNFIYNAAGDKVTWMSADATILSNLAARLVSQSTGTLKGSLSDKDLEFLNKLAPSIKNSGQANRAIISSLRRLYNRQAEFSKARAKAMALGESYQFLNKWQAYNKDVPDTTVLSYDDWEARIPKYDSDAKRK